jgi:hypothetical protein
LSTLGQLESDEIVITSGLVHVEVQKFVLVLYNIYGLVRRWISIIINPSKVISPRALISIY